MPQIANLTLNNGSAVSKTFGVAAARPDDTVWMDRSSGIPTSFPVIHAGLKLASSPDGVNRSTHTTELPVIDPVTNKVVRTLRAKTEFILPNGSTDAERKDLYAFHHNGNAHTQVIAIMRDLDPGY